MLEIILTMLGISAAVTAFVIAICSINEDME
jgi:hypothetical protein